MLFQALSTNLSTEIVGKWNDLKWGFWEIMVRTLIVRIGVVIRTKTPAPTVSRQARTIRLRHPDSV